MNNGKWEIPDIETHIKCNLNESYSFAIVVGAFFKYVFGEYPKIGLSGHQASAIDFVLEKIVEAKTQSGLVQKVEMTVTTLGEDIYEPRN